MSLASLTRTDVETPLGVLPLWHRSSAWITPGPALICINDAFADIETMSRLPDVLDGTCEVFVMHLPGRHAPALKQTGWAACALAIGQMIEARFQDRPLVLTGFGAAGAVALAVRARAVKRIVAVEPLLTAEGVWPLQGRLQQLCAIAPGLAPLLESLSAPERPLAPLEGLNVLADVMLGEIPLGAPRALDRAPSLVGDAIRRGLAAHPLVQLHEVPGAGHGIAVQAPAWLKMRLEAAVTAARGQGSFDAVLLEKAPLAVENLGYAGPVPAAFAAAWTARNPKGRIVAAETPQALNAIDGGFAALVVHDLNGVDAGWIDSRLAPGGVVIGGLSDGLALDQVSSGLRIERIYRARLTPDAFDDELDVLTPETARAITMERLVVIARATGEPASTPLPLRMVTYSPRMMDIRTRLPAQALRTDPELIVAHHGPPFRAPDAPSILLLQRPAQFDLNLWREWMSVTFRKRHLIVLEWDDHPDLVLRMGGMQATEADWRAFGFAHAIQTSTPDLARFFGRYNPEVAVFANGVFDLPPLPAPGRAPTVFYGATPRGEVGPATARALAPLLSERPDVAFEVVGDRSVFDALPTANKRFHQFLAYEAYLSLMGRCTILLTPLEAGVHEGKSDAKFLDAASRGVLTIASPTVYADTIGHGETGLIAPTLADWPRMLRRALEDPQEADAMTRRAYDYVRTQRMFADQIPARRAWYAGLMARREALNAGVMARLPGLEERLRT